MEYKVIIEREGEIVCEQEFLLEANVTDPGGRYTLSKADVKTKSDTFARAVEFAAQAHINLTHVEELVSGQSAHVQARRAAARVESLRKKTEEAQAKLAALQSEATASEPTQAGA